MGSEERLSTRDIASPGGAETDPETDPRFERDTVAAEAPATEPQPPTDAPPATGELPATEPAAQPGADAVAPVPAGGREETVDTVDTPVERDTRSGTAVSEAPAEPAADHAEAPLLDDSEGLQSRWEEIQVRFVDEPRGAVEDADALVATVMQRLAEGFAQEREHLEAQWGRGEDISTEDLRVALQRYRSFFRRLLAT
jgi:hypothetical protein